MNERRSLFFDAVKIPGRVIQNEKEGIFGKDHYDGIRRNEVGVISAVLG
jgi:hypothetical protein